jgi:hypothetical protein
MDRRDVWFLGGLAAFVAAGVWYLRRRKAAAPWIEQEPPNRVEQAKSWVIDAPGQKPAVVVPHAVETLVEG